MARTRHRQRLKIYINSSRYFFYRYSSSWISRQLSLRIASTCKSRLVRLTNGERFVESRFSAGVETRVDAFKRNPSSGSYSILMEARDGRVTIEIVLVFSSQHHRSVLLIFNERTRLDSARLCFRPSLWPRALIIVLALNAPIRGPIFFHHTSIIKSIMERALRFLQSIPSPWKFCQA